MYKYILFDLDGTLTDSAPGIIRCVQYALEKAAKAAIPTTSCCPLSARRLPNPSRISAA